VLDIPVVLFVFKRKDTLSRIISRIRDAGPRKIYIIADGPRTEEEKLLTDEVRSYVESLIDWDCEVVKNYAEENKGVYDRIGKGAKWVLETEESAIFLEDDNLPETSFFRFCQEMLERYKEDTRVLWVCGTNYLEKYSEPNNASYVYTQHLLPCGWATWAPKYNKYYDGDLKLLSENSWKSIESSYSDSRLYQQDKDVVIKTKRLLETLPNIASWDRQMLFSLRVNSLYGIAPTVNLIKNIGVDEHSTHGGNSMKKTMTGRFCEIPTTSLTFPLKHPTFMLPDSKYEKLVGEIILYPLLTRIMMSVVRNLKPLFGLRTDESIVIKLRQRKKNNNNG
tara:strand:- start:10992 stop:11999 length:1008 start_codon:yes stop_codon:yes gene_type:complete